MRPTSAFSGHGWRQLTQPSTFTTRQAALLVLVAFTLIFLRAPWLVTGGRVWAEEGTTYLRYAWNAPAWNALLAPHQGYYSLWDNGLSLIAARVLPLSAAALLFTWAALLVQLLTVYLAVSCSLATSFAARLLALLALVFTSASKEVWLNMENCQFWFPVCVALLLVGESSRHRPARLCGGLPVNCGHGRASCRGRRFVPCRRPAGHQAPLCLLGTGAASACLGALLPHHQWRQHLRPLAGAASGQPRSGCALAPVPADYWRGIGLSFPGELAFGQPAGRRHSGGRAELERLLSV